MRSAQTAKQQKSQHTKIGGIILESNYTKCVTMQTAFKIFQEVALSHNITAYKCNTGVALFYFFAIPGMLNNRMDVCNYLSALKLNNNKKKKGF